MFHTHITGVILAGGRATRMGGQDKGLIQLKNKYLIEYVVAALRPQVNYLFINANRNQSRYAELTACPVISDIMGDYAGPLAGMATGLTHAQTEYVLFVPCDSPLISSQLVVRLYTGLIQMQAEISVAKDASHIQPVFALIKRSLLPDLLDFLHSGERKIDVWYARHHMVQVDFTDSADTFLNINTLEECALLLNDKKLP